jgi:hypothetical protein
MIMALSTNIEDEAIKIDMVIRSHFSGKIYGKDAILEMKRNKMNWRQMEWPGWYFEEFGLKFLQSSIGGKNGPRYGNTTFDYQNQFVWDLKLHSLNASNKIVLNDWEAVRAVISNYYGVGFVIGMAKMEYDTTGEFKRWHDNLKGGATDFEIDRIKRGAPTRKRKTSFTLTKLIILFFKDFFYIEKGKEEGWIREFQRGMRNSNGSARRPKIAIDLGSIPSEIVIQSR